MPGCVVEVTPTLTPLIAIASTVKLEQPARKWHSYFYIPRILRNATGSMSPHHCCATTCRLALRQKQLFAGAALSRSCVRQFTTTPPARAGHNKWSKTKHIKAVTDKKKNTERTFFAAQIALYSRMYGEDLKFNPQLANTVAAATKGMIFQVKQ